MGGRVGREREVSWSDIEVGRGEPVMVTAQV